MHSANFALRILQGFFQYVFAKSPLFPEKKSALFWPRKSAFQGFRNFFWPQKSKFREFGNFFGLKSQSLGNSGICCPCRNFTYIETPLCPTTPPHQHPPLTRSNELTFIIGVNGGWGNSFEFISLQTIIHHSSFIHCIHSILIHNYNISIQYIQFN